MRLLGFGDGWIAGVREKEGSRMNPRLLVCITSAFSHLFGGIMEEDQVLEKRL